MNLGDVKVKEFTYIYKHFRGATPDRDEKLEFGFLASEEKKTRKHFFKTLNRGY